jgi:hypothetical protein
MKYQVTVSYSKGITEFYFVSATTYEQAIDKTIAKLEKIFDSKVIRHPDSNNAKYAHCARIIDYWGTIIHEIEFEWLGLKE